MLRRMTCFYALILWCSYFSVLLSANPATAYEKYLFTGLGSSQISIESSSTAIDGRSSNGLTMFIGYAMSETWSMEVGLSDWHDLNVGPTQDISYPADTAEFSVISLGYRKSLWSVDDKGWAPWLMGGVGVASINWDSFFYSIGGFTYYYAFGIDIKITRPVLLRLQSIRHHFSASDAYSSDSSYYTEVPELGVVLVFRWGLPRKSISYNTGNSGKGTAFPRYGDGYLEWSEVEQPDEPANKEESLILQKCFENATSVAEMDKCHDEETTRVNNSRYLQSFAEISENDGCLQATITSYEQCLSNSTASAYLDSCVDIFAERMKRISIAKDQTKPEENLHFKITTVFCDNESLITADYMDCVDEKVEAMNKVVSELNVNLSDEDMSVNDDYYLDLVYCTD